MRPNGDRFPAEDVPTTTVTAWLCEQSIYALTSKPPMSWDANAKPDTVTLSAPRSASAMASNVDSQSPPQCLILISPCSSEDPHGAHHREALPAHRTRSRKDDRLADAKAALQQLKDELVVHDRVRVVHPHRVRAVVEHDLRVRDALAKVRLRRSASVWRSRDAVAHLEGVDAEVDEGVQLGGVPVPRRGVGDVDDAKARLPQVPSGRLSGISRMWRRKAYCQGVPSLRLIRKPPLTASSKTGDSCEMYGLTGGNIL